MDFKYHKTFNIYLTENNTSLLWMDADNLSFILNTNGIEIKQYGYLDSEGHQLQEFLPELTYEPLVQYCPSTGRQQGMVVHLTSKSTVEQITQFCTPAARLSDDSSRSSWILSGYLQLAHSPQRGIITINSHPELFMKFSLGEGGIGVRRCILTGFELKHHI